MVPLRRKDAPESFSRSCSKGAQVSFLGPFRYRDFTLLWSGLLVGNFGSWFQFTALGYYVATLAPDTPTASFYVGLVGASQMVAVLAASPYGGVVADRYPRRRILLITNVTNALISVLLASAIFAHAGLGAVLVLSGAQAVMQSFDTPARQSWVSHLVPPEMLGTALPLNSFAFNMPSVAGPPLAGLLIAVAGIAPCMVINGVLRFAVVAALVLMRPAPPGSGSHASFTDAFVEGVNFIYSHAALRWIFLLLIVSSLTMRACTFLLPAYAVHVIQTDARGLGTLMAANGLGAVLGSLAIAALSVRRRGRAWFVSASIAALGVAAFGLTASVSLSAAVLVAVGFGTQGFVSMSNVLMQTLAPDGIRGRLVSIYAMILIGIVPGGALLIGSLAGVVDLRTIFVGAGLICAVVGCWTYYAHPKLRLA